MAEVSGSATQPHQKRTAFRKCNACGSNPKATRGDSSRRVCRRREVRPRAFLPLREKTIKGNVATSFDEVMSLLASPRGRLPAEYRRQPASMPGGGSGLFRSTGKAAFCRPRLGAEYRARRPRHPIRLAPCGRLRARPPRRSTGAAGAGSRCRRKKAGVVPAAPPVCRRTRSGKSGPRVPSAAESRGRRKIAPQNARGEKRHRAAESELASARRSRLAEKTPAEVSNKSAGSRKNPPKNRAVQIQ